MVNKTIGIFVLLIIIFLEMSNALVIQPRNSIRKLLGVASIFISLGNGAPVTAKINDPVAMERWQRAYEELRNLDSNWEKIVNDNKSGTNGDNVRRKLGTVYTPPNCESPLCSFSSFVNKFVKVTIITSLKVACFK